ncbi:MAG: ABC transporter permease subunit [Oscillospiraceae bacterium]|nr:ABC transporter permease subunit [Oscillospiraceae bacterium]
MDQDKSIMDTEPMLQQAADAVLPEVPAKAEETPKNNLHEEPTFWHLQWKRIKKHRRILWFIIPAAVFSFIFSYIPMVGVLYSFKDFSDFDVSLGMFGSLFEGGWTFQNYLDIFSDNGDVFFAAVGNTLIISVARLIICFPFSIIIAVQLSELKSQTLSKVILIILCIPNFLSWAIVIGVWWGLLDSDVGVLGFVNVVAPSTGDITTHDIWFRVLVVAWSAWKGAGWGCIMFYAAIMGIDKSYYESATLEGANRLQKMWYLTIPSILPTIALMLVMNISGLFAAGFEQIYTMMGADGGHLKESQQTLDTYIYEVARGSDAGNIPYSTALGVFNGVIALALMLIGNKITTKTLKRGLW